MQANFHWPLMIELCTLLSIDLAIVSNHQTQIWKRLLDVVREISPTLSLCVDVVFVKLFLLDLNRCLRRLWLAFCFKWRLNQIAEDIIRARNLQSYVFLVWKIVLNVAIDHKNLVLLHVTKFLRLIDNLLHRFRLYLSSFHLIGHDLRMLFHRHLFQVALDHKIGHLDILLQFCTFIKNSLCLLLFLLQFLK